jgi:hypothetical protein
MTSKGNSPTEEHPACSWGTLLTMRMMFTECQTSKQRRSSTQGTLFG